MCRNMEQIGNNFRGDLEEVYNFKTVTCKPGEGLVFPLTLHPHRKELDQRMTYFSRQCNPFYSCNMKEDQF